MRKSKLKSGMAVTLRDKSIGIIIKTHIGLIIQFDNSYIRVASFNNDLTNKGTAKLDIVTVASPQTEAYIVRKLLYQQSVIWIRKEKPIVFINGKEYTESDIKLLIEKSNN